MTDDELSRLLGAGRDVPEDAAHRARLEAELLARFDAQQAGRALEVQRHAPVHRPRGAWLRYATAAVFALALGTATQVPAAYRVQLGLRLSLTLPGAGLPPPEVARGLSDLLRAQAPGGPVEVDLQVRRLEGRGTALVLDAWGERLAADARLAERVRALPGLREAQVAVEPLRAPVRGTLLGLGLHTLLRRDLSPEEREQARLRLVEELQAREGRDAEVDVQVEPGGSEGPGGVRVRVRKQVPGPAQEEPGGSR
jgi:hypothetical protein